MGDLVGRGFDDEAARSRAALLAVAEAGLPRRTPAGPLWRWLVPGRLEIFGKHTDYAGGRSLLAAAPRGFAVAARARDDHMVRVVDARYGDEVLIDSTRDAQPRRGWAAVAGVVVRRLARNFPGAALGAEVAIASDLPRAAGLSSSTALLVGVTSALVRRAAIDTRDEWRQAIATPLDLAGYLGGMESGTSYRTLAGVAGVGTEGGSEDHTAILACQPGVVSQYGFMPVRHLTDAAMPASWSFVVASSGVRADKAGSARDRFNRASRAARAAVAVWNEAAGAAARSLADVPASPADTARLEAALAGARVPGFESGDLLRRVAHFRREDARAPEAAAAFRAADAEAVGALARASQADAETLLGNQVPETIRLAAAARACGAYAASSFGAGFGGSVWALVSSVDATAFGEEWTSAYQARYPQLTHVEWFTARPAPSLVKL